MSFQLFLRICECILLSYIVTYTYLNGFASTSNSVNYDSLSSKQWSYSGNKTLNFAFYFESSKYYLGYSLLTNEVNVLKHMSYFDPSAIVILLLVSRYLKTEFSLRILMMLLRVWFVCYPGFDSLVFRLMLYLVDRKRGRRHTLWELDYSIW